MLTALSREAVIGRALAAGRMLAGWDQTQLSRKADVSASTISNVERGNEAREDTIAGIKKALRRVGIKVSIDITLGLEHRGVSWNRI